MDMDRNKAVVLAFIERLEALDYDGATALMTDDVTWWDVMRGDMNNTDYLAAAKQFGQHYKSSMKLTVHGITSEDDRVAVELESYVTLNNNRIYNNAYHMLITLKDEKICRIKEYMNTRHVLDIVASLAE